MANGKEKNNGATLGFEAELFKAADKLRGNIDGHITHGQTRVIHRAGYEINFNCHVYRCTPPRPLEEIGAELKQAEEEILRLLREATA